MKDFTSLIVFPSTTLLEAAKVIQANAARTAVVVQDSDRYKIVGIVTEGDILRAMLRNVDIHAPVAEHMKIEFSYLQSEDWEQAACLFASRGFCLIPIVNKAMELQSVMTVNDYLRRQIPS
ncbi:MAG: CBS domain-containing protein [Candidatus Peribacteraceae bacterium]|nr:CBS domain-containing protein [Candidatus Peribacteraceae bacterium]